MLRSLSFAWRAAWLTQLVIAPLAADTRIVIPLRHPPQEIVDQASRQAEQEHIVNKIAQFEHKPPSKLTQKQVKGALVQYLNPSLGGLVALYAGYLDYSDSTGIISFPLRHSAPKVYLAITNTIRLIKVRGQTVSHREFVPKEAQTQLYLLTKNQDPDGTAFWRIQEEPLPANNKINPLTIVLLTKPKNVVIAPGDFQTAPGVQLILPDIYVVGNVGNASTILQALDFKYLFEPMKCDERKISETVVQKISVNI